MMRGRVLLLILACSAGAMPVLQEQRADILIRSGRIVDGSGSPPYAGGVAIRDGRIIAAGVVAGIEAERVIEARGYTIVPGFIDLHSHADWGFSDPHLAAAVNNLTQGVTTVVVGQDGRHAWPVGSTLTAQAEAWTRQGAGNNIIPLVGQGSARLEVMGWKQGPASADEAKQVADVVRGYLQQGAWGVSSGLGYHPGRFSTTEEVIAAVRPVQEIDGFYISHLRNQGPQLAQSIQELIEISRETGGVRSVATHLKASGKRNWGASRAAVNLLGEARARGLPVYGDVYPYETSSDGIDVSLISWRNLFTDEEMQKWLPPVALEPLDLLKWAFDLQPRLRRFYTFPFLASRSPEVIRNVALGSLRERLRPRELIRRRIREIMGDPARRGELLDAVRLRIDAPGGAEIFRIDGYPEQNMIGRSLEQVALAWEMTPAEAAVQLTLAGAVFTQLHMSEEDLQVFMRQPYVAGCTDGWIPEYGHGMTHPRSYGAFTRRLYRYVYHLGLLRLPLAIYQVTALPAEIIGLEDRGLIKEGYWADIVLFDPRRVRDRATFAHPHRLSQGIDWVLVNGEIAVERGSPTRKLAGKVLLKR